MRRSGVTLTSFCARLESEGEWEGKEESERE